MNTLNQSTGQEKYRLSDEQIKGLEACIGSTPFIAFSSATLHDCVRFDGLALNLDYINQANVPTIFIPVDFAAPVASAILCENLIRINSVWVLNENACRFVIDAILTQVLLQSEADKLFGFCQVKNDWQGVGFGYTGNVDYMFGSTKTQSVGNMDSSLMVMIAKKEWPDSDIPKILCKAGCLLKRRLASGKNTPVFAVLTNGSFFRFFALDTNGLVYSSGVKILNLGPDGTYHSSTSLSEILRWFAWMMVSIQSFSPGSGLMDSLAQIRSCFGPKTTISSKKVKVQPSQ